MSGTTWSKFYWSDWETDHALRLCSLAAQGLWMRMLCIAASHDPIGYVAVAGRGLDETSLARMTGSQESEVAALLGELERNGVFSRDRHGRAYSRRMVADAKKAAISKKNGKTGGNPSLCKQKGNSGWDNPEDKSRDNTHKPYANSQIYPSHLSDVREVPAAKASRGTRLPEGWRPSEANWRDAVARLGEVDAERELARFCNFWIAKPGKDGLKLDWDRTWLNWISKAIERLEGQRNGRNDRNSGQRRLTGTEQRIAGLAAAADKLAHQRLSAEAAREHGAVGSAALLLPAMPDEPEIPF